MSDGGFPWGRVLATLALLAIAAAMAATFARGHDAPAGWRYDAACCSGIDCYPIDAAEVAVTADGWRVVRTGEVIPFGHRKERESPDGLFHRCSGRAGNPDAHTICLYVPKMGF